MSGKDSLNRPHGSCFTRMSNAAMIGASVGTFYGSCTIAWNHRPIPSADPRFGAVTRNTDLKAGLRTIAFPLIWFGATGMAFAAGECYAEAARNGKQDAFNAATGGATAGAIMGAVVFKRMDAMAATALGMGVLMFMADYAVDREPNWDLKDEKSNPHHMYDVRPKIPEDTPTLAELKEKYFGK